MQSQSQFYVDELKSYFQQQDKQDIKFEETMQILKLDSESSINNYISNSQNRCQSNTNEINLKKKTIVFNKQFKRFKETQSQLLIQKKYTFEKDLRLSQGLLISTEGIIRTDYSIVQLSFGYLYNASIVKFLKKQYIVEVQYDQIQQNHEISLKDAYNYLCKTPCQQIQSSYYAIQSVYEQKRKLRTELDSIKITQDLIQLYNQQLYLFMQKCDAYIEQYNQQNDGAIFQYFIRKINLSTKTEEIAKVGYSKSFLDLIGASVDKFCSMLLSNQKVDLVQNQQEILNQAINGIHKYFKNNFVYSNQSQLTTLDGFRLNFSYSMEHVDLREKFQLKSQLPFRQTITIAKIQIDIQEIQNLVSFRFQNMRKQTNLSFQEYIQQELSNLYLNSAFPTQSQVFIQKYYQQNIEEIYKQQMQNS